METNACLTNACLTNALLVTFTSKRAATVYQSCRKYLKKRDSFDWRLGPTQICIPFSPDQAPAKDVTGMDLLQVLPRESRVALCIALLSSDVQATFKAAKRDVCFENRVLGISHQAFPTDFAIWSLPYSSSRSIRVPFSFRE